MRTLPFFTRGTLALLLIGLGAPLSAQQQAEIQSWRVPGWSFTPGVAIGVMADSNVGVLGPDEFGETNGDSSFQLDPFGQLEFFSARTAFSSGYRGGIRHYFELSPLDSVEHRGYLTLQHKLSRRTALRVHEDFTQQPTTDNLQLNGVPFARVGSRYNLASVTLETRATRKLDVSGEYENSWVSFAPDSSSLLTGGVVQGLHGIVREHLTSRVSAGGEYGFRWANLNDGLRQYTYQDFGGVFQYRADERTMVEFAAGLSRLHDTQRDVDRNSPYARASVSHQMQRATVGGEYRHSYSPSFFLGGSHLGREIRAYVDMPFNRNRIYVNEMFTWRRTDPVVETTTPLDTVGLRSSVGYTVQRWLRVEGYHSYMNQDNSLAGGQIKRQVVGVQLVVSEPVRIR